MSIRRWLPRRRGEAAPEPRGIACRDMVELVTDYLEGALDDGERARFEAHLARCEDCAAYVEQLRETVAITGRLAPVELPEHLQRDLLDAFRDWKEGSR